MVCPPRMVGNHLLPVCSGLCGQARLCGAGCSEQLSLCFLWPNTHELAFPSYLPGRFAGGSNLLGQGGRGMGAACEKDVMLIGKGRSLVIDHTGEKKKKRDPTAFLSHFFVFQLKKEPR